MSMEEVNVNVEEEMVENLMAKGFGDPAPNRRCRAAKRLRLQPLVKGP